MEVAFDTTISIVSLTLLGQHARAGKTHFASEKMPPGAFAIAAVALLAGVFHLWLTWTAPQPPAAQAAGLVVQLASWSLFQRTIRASRSAGLRVAFDPSQPHCLVTEGPYRYARHPFYASYLLFWAGWSLANWTPITLAPLVIIAAMYVLAARIEEKNFAATALAAQYRAYQSRTGIFCPKFS